MKATFEKEALLLAITRSLGCVAEKMTSVIEGIYINTVGDDRCQVCAYDIEKGIKIEISARNGNDLVVKPITLWCSNTNSYNGELTVTQFGAESKREGDLNLRLYSSKNYGFNETLILAISVSLIAFIIAKVDMDRKEKEKRETDASTKSDCIESKS